jgi:hypothetical protein
MGFDRVSPKEQHRSTAPTRTIARPAQSWQERGRFSYGLALQNRYGNAGVLRLLQAQRAATRHTEPASPGRDSEELEEDAVIGPEAEEAGAGEGVAAVSMPPPAAPPPEPPPPGGGNDGQGEPEEGTHSISVGRDEARRDAEDHDEGVFEAALSRAPDLQTEGPEEKEPSVTLSRATTPSEGEAGVEEDEESHTVSTSRESPRETGSEGCRARSEIVSASVAGVLASGGQPLVAATRTRMEQSLGQDFGDVRVHTDPQAAESARALSAKAYTVGSNVVLGAGQYAPETTAGARLLGHELAHVIQQREAGRVLASGKLTVAPAGTALEREADAAGDLVASSRTSARSGAQTVVAHHAIPGLPQRAADSTSSPSYEKEDTVPAPQEAMVRLLEAAEGLARRVIQAHPSWLRLAIYFQVGAAKEAGADAISAAWGLRDFIQGAPDRARRLKRMAELTTLWPAAATREEAERQKREYDSLTTQVKATYEYVREAELAIEQGDRDKAAQLCGRAAWRVTMLVALILGVRGAARGALPSGPTPLLRRARTLPKSKPLVPQPTAPQAEVPQRIGPELPKVTPPETEHPPVSERSRPPGGKARSVQEGGRAAKMVQERQAALDDYLRGQGRTVEPNPLEGKPGVGRQGDRIVDGVKTEYKSLDPGATDSTVRNAVNNSIRRGGQARAIVIDARGSGLTEEAATQGLNRVSGITRGKLDRVEVVGEGYHIDRRF